MAWPQPWQPVRLTSDESRALGFVALLLTMAAVVRVLDRPKPLALDAPALDLAALEAAGQEERAAQERRSRPLAPGERIDPNTAPAEELDRLPGVGPALAARIVAERERGGPFRTTADLARVPGLGAAAIQRIAPHLTLPASTPGADGRQRFHTGERAVGSGLERETGRDSGPPTPLDINRATAADFERLPGIGPALARRIVRYRDSVGGFRSLEELDRVPGIGPATLARIAPLLRTP